MARGDELPAIAIAVGDRDRRGWRTVAMSMLSVFGGVCR
jgi:hypothetical protein